MGQFHLTVYVSNSRFAHIATEAMLDRAPITMNGEFDDEIRTVTGFVQSIEADANAMPRRWRITILEDQRHSERVVSFLRRFRPESPCECEGQSGPASSIQVAPPALPATTAPLPAAGSTARAVSLSSACGVVDGAAPRPQLHRRNSKIKQPKDAIFNPLEIQKRPFLRAVTIAASRADRLFLRHNRRGRGADWDRE